MGIQVAVQGPAALKNMPGSNGPEGKYHQGCLFPEGIFCKEIERSQAQKADYQLGQPGRYRVQAKEFYEGNHEVAEQGAHLVIAPGCQVHGIAHAVSVGTVIRQSLGIHRSHGPVLVETSRYLAKFIHTYK